MLKLLALCLVITQTPLPLVEQAVAFRAPIPETRGALVPPPRQPPTAVATEAVPPDDDPGSVQSVYPESTRMARIARGLLVASAVTAVACGARACAG